MNGAGMDDFKSQIFKSHTVGIGLGIGLVLAVSQRSTQCSHWLTTARDLIQSAAGGLFDWVCVCV